MICSVRLSLQHILSVDGIVVPLCWYSNNNLGFTWLQMTIWLNMDLVKNANMCMMVCRNYCRKSVI